MQIKEWIRRHKTIATVIATCVATIVIIFVVLMALMSLSGARSKSVSYTRDTLSSPLASPSYSEFALINPLAKEEAYDSGTIIPSDSGREIEVKEGSMQIDSKVAENDSDKIKSVTESYRGYTERSNKSISNLYVQLSLTLRVPSENFASLVDKIKEDFEVESYSVKNYRISVGREMDEVDILSDSLADYEKIREEINRMSVGKDKIDLLMQLTDKELELKGKERNYQSIVSSKEKQGEYATLSVSLKEKRSPTVWPEGVLDQFKDRLRTAINNTVKILKDLIGGSIEIFFRTIQVAVYVFIVIIVLAVFYRLGRGLINLLFQRKINLFIAKKNSVNGQTKGQKN